jgi:[protein-PII] uridylyltransferase
LIRQKEVSPTQARSATLVTVSNAGQQNVTLQLDRTEILAAISKLASSGANGLDLRAALVGEVGAAYRSNFDTLSAFFDANPLASAELRRGFSDLSDFVVSIVFQAVTTFIHPLPNPTEAERISVLAVGGSGRAEMAPFSDIDLLFLTPYKTPPWAESVIESTLYVLWDLKLKIGNASRTLDECIRLGRKDFTIRTSLLENRCICGDRALSDLLDQRLWQELFEGTGPEFVEAKLAEREERHRKNGMNRYLVEPNVKEGKGGLRDLQSLFWIAKYLHRVDKTHDLVNEQVFTENEYQMFKTAEDFLWSVRCHLHFLGGRANEHLRFDIQVDLAARLEYQDHDGRRAVEHFMQDYFRQATHVGELTRVFLTSLEAQHVKQQPSVRRIFRKASKRITTRLSAEFHLQQNRLAISDETAFLADPTNILRLFDEGLRTGYLIHPDAMRLVANNLDLFDDKLRHSDIANELFIGLMLDRGNPVRALRRMNELGVLSAFMPEFQPIVAMMQFNMYHHYTVDEHTIQCISHLAEIEAGNLVDDLPVASEIFQHGINRRILYVALLLHDIGKGRPQDHSVLGAEIAAQVCPRLGLDEDEVETVVWLVRNHLIMSDVAQKRDLSDPRTVRDFATTVQSPTRLKLLTVLTVCDIRGVGPGVWNNWKAQLLRELYRETHRALTSGLDSISDRAPQETARAELAAHLSSWKKADRETEISRHYPPYWQGLDGDTHKTMALLLRNISDSEIRLDLTIDKDRDATRACFAMVDHPGIFSRLAGALALVDANVVDARTYTSADGYATAVFWVQDANSKPYAKSRMKRLQTMIDKSLSGEILTQDALKDRDKIKKRERQFRVPTAIDFDNEGSEIYTIIEVDTRDRPGLLFDLTHAITSANIYIASAVIATYGAQAVDVFYVKDMFGLKLHSKQKRNSLEAKLRDAIDRGFERAAA